jgi:hypothetical protein
MDFKNRIKNRLELAPGGYIGVLGTNGWTQIQANKITAVQSCMPHGSRRQRRTLAKTDWKASTR